jgi:hypothetical protein
VHWLLLIPHYFVVFFLVVGVWFSMIVVSLSILFTRRYPPGIFNYIAGVGRWLNRVTLYYHSMTEEYPPFSLDPAPYPVRTSFEYPEAGISRWRPFVQGILAIPHLIIIYLLGIASRVIGFVGAIAVLFTGQYPPSLFTFMIGVQRWQTRAIAYYLLMTEEYPPFSLD